VATLSLPLACSRLIIRGKKKEFVIVGRGTMFISERLVREAASGQDSFPCALVALVIAMKMAKSISGTEAVAPWHSYNVKKIKQVGKGTILLSGPIYSTGDTP
jgi:hypothetical protein